VCEFQSGLVEPLFHQSAFSEFPFEFLVGCGKFGSSLYDPSIEFAGDPLLLAQEPCLLQSNGRLIRCHAQKKCLGLARKIRTLRPGYDHTNFTVQPQAQGHDRNTFVSKAVPYQRRPFLWVISPTAPEYLADLLRSSLQFSRLTDAGHLDRRFAAWVVQPHIDEIEVEHTQERVDQGMNNLGRLGTGPHGRERENAEQIIHATLETLDFLGGMFDLHFHV
jgi:hypothetical protein